MLYPRAHRRRPAALIPAPLARTLGFALLATLGAAEWARMLEGGGLADALPWVLAAVLAGEAVGAAASLPPRLRVPAAALAAALGLLLAALASGLEPRLLAPAHWDELGAGVGRGLEALSGVTLPYGGADPWPDVTLRLGGALLVTLAARARGLAARGGPRLPVLRARRPARARRDADHRDRHAALARARRRARRAHRLLPVARAAAAAARASASRCSAAIALAGALPLSAAADRDGPWFDYRTWAEGLGTPASVRFDWDHSYGPLRLAARGARDAADPDRRGRSTGSSRTSRTSTAQRWVMRGVPDPYGPEPEADLEQSWTDEPAVDGQRARHRARPARRRVRRCGHDRSRSTPARGARWRRSRPGPGRPTKSSRPGESYRVRFHAPRPNALELPAASSGARGQQGDALERPVCRCCGPSCPPRATRVAPRDGGQARAAPVRAPSARRSRMNERRGTTEPGGPALRNSPYWRTWQLAQRLKRGTRTPYEFVRRVDAYLGRGFRYDERPAPGRAGRGAARALPVRHQGRLLPALLGRDGAAAALRRRAGARGVRLLARRLPPPPGRVGRARPRRALVGRGVVRRHRLGHVRPDADRDPGALADRRDRRSRRCRGGRLRAPTPPRPSPAALATRPACARELEPPAASGGPGLTAADDGPSTLLLAGAAASLLVALAGRSSCCGGVAAQPGTLPPADRAVADLVTALRRAGRPVAAGDDADRARAPARRHARRRRLPRDAAGRPLRHRATSAPTPASARAFRRELAAGLGWRGRLRAWWALPPQLR